MQTQTDPHQPQPTPRVSDSTAADKSIRIPPEHPDGPGHPDEPGRAGPEPGSGPGRAARRDTDVSAGDNSLRVWTDISKLNYLSSAVFGSGFSGENNLNKKLTLSLKDIYKSSTLKLVCLSDIQIIDEKFPKNVTSLMDEQQLWGCFYPFPQLYDDQYSPPVPIRTLKDLGVVEESVLSRAVVGACLSYLRRAPLLEDFVFIKLTLPYMNLINIDVLADYRYLVYLDLQGNALTELRVLSRLPLLQHLDVGNNLLRDVLHYDTPQWYLSTVIYKYNSVKLIKDLSKFWSITVLDLSNNNIVSITGLQSLMYLRRLDLSFNHIQRVENLNHLNLIWLDLSYNNISSFEAENNRGLSTLLHLKYLNLNDNKLGCLKIFSGCTRLQEVYLRNNHLESLLEVAVYMGGLRRLSALDLRGNPLQALPDYGDVIVNCFPLLMHLDAVELEPVKQRMHMMRMHPDVRTFATRRLLRLLYIEQLGRARTPPAAPPADTTDVPIVVLVGRVAVGKGKLSRRLASECARRVALGVQHTTCLDHEPGHYLPVDAHSFDQMLVRGELLTYSETYGYSYGLSREQATVRDGRVRLVCMDLIPALMLQLRGLRPLLVLASCRDRDALARRQEERAQARSSAMPPPARAGPSTLQVMLSASFVAHGVLNEIIMQLPDDQRQAFLRGSGCSLTLASAASRAASLAAARARDAPSTSAVTPNAAPTSSCSLYRDSVLECAGGSRADVPGGSDGGSDAGDPADGGDGAGDGGGQMVQPSSKSLPDTFSKLEFSASPAAQNTSVSKNNLTFASSRVARSSKSVSFTSELTDVTWRSQSDITGLLLEEPGQAESRGSQNFGSKLKASVSASCPFQRAQGDDLWIKFLMDNGLLTLSDDDSFTINEEYQLSDKYSKIIKHIGGYEKPAEYPHKTTTTTRMDLETIHRACPGLFWDTVMMDDPDKAFAKMKRILRDAVQAQPTQAPLFDTQFPAARYANVRRQLARVVDGLGANKLFH